jgi:hypothetical protein
LKLVPRAGVDGARPRVIIVGAGFGGLTVAKRLAKTPGHGIRTRAQGRRPTICPAAWSFMLALDWVCLYVVAARCGKLIKLII